MTPHHANNPQAIVNKMCICDYVVDIDHSAKFYFDPIRGFFSRHLQLCKPRVYSTAYWVLQR